MSRKNFLWARWVAGWIESGGKSLLDYGTAGYLFYYKPEPLAIRLTNRWKQGKKKGKAGKKRRKRKRKGREEKKLS